jgi:glyoxylase-like metal-dependent hydrolase (beta-lactamase superfamily II)
VKLTDHVYFYQRRVPSSNTTVIKAKEQIIIDPGVSTGLNRLFSLMRRDGLNPEDTTQIWLTHAHPDHTQAAKLMENKCKIMCHPKGREILESASPLGTFLKEQIREVHPILKLFFSKKPWIIAFLESVLTIDTWLIAKGIAPIWRTVTIHETFEENEVDVGIPVKVIFLPGHCPSGVGFWISNDSILIIGDLVALKSRGPVLGVNIVLSDLNYSIESLEKMKELKPKILLAGHGRMINEPDVILQTSLGKLYAYKSRAITYTKQGIKFWRVTKRMWEDLPPGILGQKWLGLAILSKMLWQEGLLH